MPSTTSLPLASGDRRVSASLIARAVAASSVKHEVDVARDGGHGIENAGLVQRVHGHWSRSTGSGQPLHARQLARVDRVAQRRDRLVAREAAAPRQHHAARRRVAVERDVLARRRGRPCGASASGSSASFGTDRRGTSVTPMPAATMCLMVSSDEPSKLLRMPSALLRKARELGADLEHVVAEAVAGAQQQHRLAA